MNMFSPYTLVPDAAYFPSLKIADEFFIQESSIYFSLIVPGNPQCYVTAVLNANEVDDSLVWNNTNDPQNDFDVAYEKLEVEPYNVAKVEDFSEVLAVQNQPFLLTNEQIADLNEMLKAHFEEEKVKELKEMVA